ncbi:Rib/alpha-like domain-containing protein, partial [Gemella sp.]
EGLPSGTTYTWVEKPDTNTTPGSKPGKVLITYPDNSTEEVPVTVEVTPQKDDYDPQPKPQTVDNGTVPNAEDSVDKTGLPSGTTIAWKETPVVNTPGSHPTVALVTYPDGTVDEVTVPITVKKQSDTYTPTPKQPGQTAKHGSEPSAEGSINTEGLPSGTTYTWVEKPDTNTTPGSKPGKVLITYPDNSTEEVSVTVEVTPQKDDYDPQPKPQTVDNGTVPNAEDSVEKTGLPEGTTVTWKTNPEVSTPGSHPGVALVHYPDGTEDEVEVPVVVRHSNEKGIPEVQPALPEFNGGANGEPEVQPVLPEFNGGVNGEPEVQPVLPEFNGGVNGEPEVQPALPEFAGGVNGDPEEQPTLPEFAGGVNGDPEEQPALPEFNGGANGEPEVQPALPEFNGGVNGESEIQPALPEFNGGVNGEPEVQPALPEFAGGVNGEPEVQPALPEFSGGVNGDSETPEYVERINDESKVQPVIPNKSSKITKRLANTGETTNNSELAGLGLAIVGLFAAIKRRKNDED